MKEEREALIERESARKISEGESKIEREKNRETVVCVCLSEIALMLLAKALYCFIASVLRGFTPMIAKEGDLCK